MARNGWVRSVLAAMALLPIACSEKTGEGTSPASTLAVTMTVEPPSTMASTTPTPVPEPSQVLVLHETAGFRHDSIPAGIAALTEIGLQEGLDVTVADDSSVLLEAGLEEFAVIVFLNTTGDILSAQEELAMEEFIRSSKGFVGVHSATDTEYDWAWYGGLVGAYFMDHPAVQPATIHSAESGHPAGAGLPSSFERVDEWYNFRSAPAPGAVVLATLDETTYEGGKMGPDHPIAWAQEYDGGRSFYTAGGHTIESYSEPLFRDHIAAGLVWAAGNG
jgi:type 1 glutamine amidotransferase